MGRTNSKIPVVYTQNISTDTAAHHQQTLQLLEKERNKWQSRLLSIWTEHSGVRDKQFGDTLYNFLMRDKEPVHDVQCEDMRTIAEYLMSGYKYETCCYMMDFNDAVFNQFYKRLDNNPSNLERLIFKHPRLLLNEYSYLLINTLSMHLQYDKLYQILLNTRDENGQTCMFYINSSQQSDLYRHHTDDLCQLFSLCNTNGQTAFHVNTDVALRILLPHITLNNRDRLMAPISIRDNNYATVYHTLLTWLKNQVEKHNYPLFDYPHVLILYNTNKRPGAKEEADSIYEALKSTTVYQWCHIELKEMGIKQAALQLIKETAANWSASALIICVMSHGSVGTIEDCNGKLMTLTSIEGAMCSDELKERPKVLIAQCCQSREESIESLNEVAASSSIDAGPTVEERVENTPYVPVADHFLAVQSSVCEQTSERNFFIPYLAEQIINSTKNDCFFEMVRKASCKMLERRKQVPIVQSTLRARVCLKDNIHGRFDENVSKSYQV